jgi:hypothetical protein
MPWYAALTAGTSRLADLSVYPQTFLPVVSSKPMISLPPD